MLRHIGNIRRDGSGRSKVTMDGLEVKISPKFQGIEVKILAKKPSDQIQICTQTHGIEIRSLEKFSGGSCLSLTKIAGAEIKNIEGKDITVDSEDKAVNSEEKIVNSEDIETVEDDGWTIIDGEGIKIEGSVVRYVPKFDTKDSIQEENVDSNNNIEDSKSDSSNIFEPATEENKTKVSSNPEPLENPENLENEVKQNVSPPDRIKAEEFIVDMTENIVKGKEEGIIKMLEEKCRRGKKMKSDEGPIILKSIDEPMEVLSDENRPPGAYELFTNYFELHGTGWGIKT